MPITPKKSGGCLNRIGLHNGNHSCRQCNKGDETAHHILWNVEALDHRRSSIYGQRTCKGWYKEPDIRKSVMNISGDYEDTDSSQKKGKTDFIIIETKLLSSYNVSDVDILWNLNISILLKCIHVALNKYRHNQYKIELIWWRLVIWLF